MPLIIFYFLQIIHAHSWISFINNKTLIASKFSILPSQQFTGVGGSNQNIKM